MKELPKPLHKLGYPKSQVKKIMRELKVKWSDFGDAFGVNTCAIAENGETVMYPCDIERALWKLKHKLGKYHMWD
jgi:hypothetical protein